MAGFIASALIVGALWTDASEIAAGSILRLELTVAAVLVAGIAASVVGFAFSPLAAALLAYLYPDPVEMVRILLVCSITIQAYCTLMLYRSIRWQELAPYLAGGLLTAPAGVFMLTWLSPHVYAFALGAFLVSYGLYSLRAPIAIGAQQGRMADMMVGALGGFTGGLAAFPGAFTAIWCSARGLPKDSQRAICQPYILFMQMATLALLHHVRPIEVGMLSSLWIYVPFSLLAAGLGFGIFRRLTHVQFRVVLLAMLIVSGGLLMLQNG
jgi:uncharacterized membrane protein YfcA